MSSLLQRTMILSLSRFGNQAIVLLSPILLVRILSVNEYGAYREFLLYAALIGPIVTFGIWKSLLYFIPKSPEDESVWITQSALFAFATTSVAIIILFLIGDVIRENVSFDFVLMLQLYIFFSINLDYIESFWLGKKKSEYVLYFSAARLLSRTSAIVVSAWYFKSAQAAIVGLIVVESVRLLLVLAYSIRRRLLVLKVKSENMRHQLSYFLPLGAGAMLEILNLRSGMLFTSIVLGVEALAFYVTGAFATQIVNVIRGAIADVIFPEIVELRHTNPRDALPIWKRATIWYCVMLFPVVVVFSLYADAIVVILFSEEYREAAPVFSAFSFVLLLHCFDFHLPLRVQNANRYYVIGNIITLILNLGFIYPMYSVFGLIGPVIAFILARTSFTVYLAQCVSRVYDVPIRHMVSWSKVGKVSIAAMCGIPILVLGKDIFDSDLIRCIVFVPVYFFLYLYLIHLFNVWSVFSLMKKSTVRRPN